MVCAKMWNQRCASGNRARVHFLAPKTRLCQESTCDIKNYALLRYSLGETPTVRRNTLLKWL